MSVVLAVPTLRRYDLLYRLLASAEAGTVKPRRYCVIDNGGLLSQHTASGSVVLPPNTDVVRPERNIGCAAAWNTALRTYGDVLISNDDIALRPDTIAAFVAAIESHPEGLCFQLPSQGWALFFQRAALAERIGFYDENFFPAYFEDNDYHRRMLLAGLDRTFIAAEVHHDRSSTLAALPAAQRHEHHAAFRACQQYYMHKWGGLPHHETNTTPACLGKW